MQLLTRLARFSSNPADKVENFVSYYDYYQPEAYVPSRDVYIEKDSSINEQMRLSATKALLFGTVHNLRKFMRQLALLCTRI
ncbi:MAG: hypothetical protein OEW48_12625 [Phycisphaerae bacterium]|nr:hypothetical protein [Phycisphaerae bacterium]